MMNQDDHFGWQVRQWLNRATTNLSVPVQSRLEQARKKALARQRKSVSSPLLNASPKIKKHLNKTNRFLNQWLLGSSTAIPALTLVLGLFLITDAQFDHEANRLATIDSLVLGDELPISAYLDEGFSAYLKHAHILPEQAQQESASILYDDAADETRI